MMARFSQWFGLFISVQQIVKITSGNEPILEIKMVWASFKLSGGSFGFSID